TNSPRCEDIGYPARRPDQPSLSEPPSTQSPFARRGHYLCRSDLEGRFEERYSLFFAHTGSCASPRSSHCLQPWPRQWVFAGCCQPLLERGPSRRYLCESFPGCLDPCHGGMPGAPAHFFPGIVGLPPNGMGWLPAFACSATSEQGMLS